MNVKVMQRIGVLLKRKRKHVYQHTCQEDVEKRHGVKIRANLLKLWIILQPTCHFRQIKTNR